MAGTLAAAAVAARLMGLDAATTTHALGIAGSGSGGLLEFLTTGASTKQLHPGAAAMTGILAARLAAAGATGPSTVLEGPHGIYAALSARDADIESVVRDLGTRWETTQITIKPYPCCQLMHVTLDAVRRGLPLDPEGVVEVTAEVHPDSAAVVCEPTEVKMSPRTSYDAKFSLPWSVAALIVDGDIGVATYEQASIARPGVAALARRVRTVLTPTAGVAADAPGRVVITTQDGPRLDLAVPRSAGGPDLPLSDEQLRAKLVGNVGDAVMAHALADALARFGDDDSGVQTLLTLATTTRSAA